MLSEGLAIQSIKPGRVFRADCKYTPPGNTHALFAEGYLARVLCVGLDATQGMGCSLDRYLVTWRQCNPTVFDGYVPTTGPAYTTTWDLFCSYFSTLDAVYYGD